MNYGSDFKYSNFQELTKQHRMFSSMNLDGFYSPETLKRNLLAQAKLNIILCEEDWLRYHRYTNNWSENVDCAQIDNGSGDHLFALFMPAGVILKGFDHESPVSPHARDVYEVWPGMYEGLPEVFRPALEDPAIEMKDVTFCLWRENRDNEWKRGNPVFNNGENDGSAFLLSTIHPDAAAYKEWADGYFERTIPLAAIEAVYNGSPLTTEVILSLNPEAVPGTVFEELKALG